MTHTNIIFLALLERMAYVRFKGKDMAKHLGVSSTLFSSWQHAKNDPYEKYLDQMAALLHTTLPEVRQSLGFASPSPSIKLDKMMKVYPEFIPTLERLADEYLPKHLEGVEIAAGELPASKRRDKFSLSKSILSVPTVLNSGGQ